MRLAILGVMIAALALPPVPALAEPRQAFDIPHIKAALRIAPAQEQYWAPVEAVLRDIARRHETQIAQASTMQRGRRGMVIVLDATDVARLKQVARPLAAALSENQKNAAVALVRRMGLTHLLADLR